MAEARQVFADDQWADAVEGGLFETHDRQSSIGRELGPYALDADLETKPIDLNLSS